LHQKYGQQALCRVLEGRGPDYDLTALAAAAEAMPAMAPEPLPGSPANSGVLAAPTATDLMVTTVRANGIDGITRHDAMTKVIGHWLRQVRLGHATLDTAWQAVVEHNAAVMVPPWPEERLRREFDAIYRLDNDRHPPDAPMDDSEDGLAALFVQLSGAEWRYVPSWGRWMRWTGNRWQHDETNAAYDAVRGICRAVAAECKIPSVKKRLASHRTMKAVLAIAAADRQIAMASNAWDHDRTLLNTPAGVVDLTSGEVFSHDPRRHMTQITGASPGGQCPRWQAFLEEITGGDNETKRYLARLAGYCLSGSTEEHALFFLHGYGSNGKSVFLQALATAYGSYAKTAPAETFMATRHSSHPTDLAGLHGARLVLVSETESNRSWAESRIKSITGGDRISARFMRHDFFEYEPTFKLLIAGNHLPRLAHVGEAMRRRIHLIPFDVTIPAGRRDPKLAEKLHGELGGILAWAIDGHVEWQRIGLAPPPKVQAAVDKYFHDEDQVGQWIEECCRVGDDLRATSADLFRSWSAFAEGHGIEKGSSRTLGEALAARGFKSGRTNRARGWTGLDLRRGGTWS
jgi:P4 family phage/plasmid primase-like protien